MRTRNPLFRLASCSAVLLLASALSSPAQALPPAPVFTSIPAVAFGPSGPVLRAPAQSQKPFTVAGERGVLLGHQDGLLEAWVLPVKLLSRLTIQAAIPGYGPPVDLNRNAAVVEVHPDRTILIYSYPGFTVRQIMFSPAAAPAGTGPIVLFDFDCLHPTDFSFRFTPELRWMWPERDEGVPDADWNPRGGFFSLHADYPDLGGAITIPGALPGAPLPDQDPPLNTAELKLHIDPVRDHGRLFPLLMAIGTTPATATDAALGARLAELNSSIQSLYKSNADHFQHLIATAVAIETPDPALNEAFQWAEISIDQLRTRTSATDETALVAGYAPSGGGVRPGFGWFFGRDSLYTLYAVNGYGDFALSRSQLEFLIHRQRADGKIMHEYSQTADAVDWKAFPFMYAAADATPLFLMAVADYVRSSGDLPFLSAQRDAVEKAWAFETDPAHDTDHDGIYDNSQGTGWVESWPGGLPHQEIYLALLDQQASQAMAYLEGLLQDSSRKQAAQHRADAVATAIESEYYDPAKSCYAFSRNLDGSLDRTSTVYPALAWWDPANRKPTLAHTGDCLQQFAAAALNTDWGLRDVADNEKIYDGMSYHQGSVWPLFTGWAALAEYRANQPLAAFQLLMENASLTRAQDLGSDTEVLSGDFFVPYTGSTNHQLWSSAMVITPTLRGLFGISVDAQARTISVDPHLPASWNHAEVKHLPIGAASVDLAFTRSKAEITVSLQAPAASGIKLITTTPAARPLPGGSLGFPRHPVEVATCFQPPSPASRTRSLRVVREQYASRQLRLTLQAPAGTEAQLPLFLADPNLKLHADGASLAAPTPSKPEIGLQFPAGDGWKTLTVTLSW